MADEKTPPKKEIAVIDEVYGTLQKMESELAKVLPQDIAPAKFVRVVRTALQKDPALLGAKRATLYSAAMRCATDGLIPDGREAALVVFGAKNQDGGDVAYMPMVAGICKRARNSGEIKTIDAVEVFTNDKYDAWIDETGPHFTFRRSLDADRGVPRLTFAYAITKDGGLYHEEIDEQQMKHIEAVSKAKGEVWAGPFRGEMKRKSALHRLGKYRLPSSSDIEGVLESDNDATGFQKPEPAVPSERPSRLGAIIEAQTVKTEAAAEKPQADKPAMDAEIVRDVPI